MLNYSVAELRYILVPFILNLAFVCSWYLFTTANIRGISMVNKKIFQKGYIYLCKRLHVLCNLFAYTHHKALFVWRSIVFHVF